jgi:triphosphoribosyl-dephospho-CoA synthase
MNPLMQTPADQLPAPLHRSAAGTAAPDHRRIGRLALRALHEELSAYPKPGLVSPVDSGSHQDMDASTFFRSLFSLRGYFLDIALAGMGQATFADLKTLAIVAEARMLQATAGINTHRGGIFNLGLLAAGAGALGARGLDVQGDALGAFVRRTWGQDIRRHGGGLPKTSHGGQVALRHGVGGAIQEAAEGFPHVFQVGLPVLQASLQAGASLHDAAVQCLFGLLAVLPDSNLLYRGGSAGLDFAQSAAQAFLAAGGVHRDGWRRHAVALHHEFVERNLSPGGSADLLAATLFVHRLQTGG